MEVFRKCLAPRNWFPRAFSYRSGFGLIIKVWNILLGLFESKGVYRVYRVYWVGRVLRFYLSVYSVYSVVIRAEEPRSTRNTRNFRKDSIDPIDSVDSSPSHVDIRSSLGIFLGLPQDLTRYRCGVSFTK